VIAPQRSRESAGTTGALRIFGLALAAACGPRPAPAPPAAADPDRIAIVASERGPRGARLVAIDEHGDRRFELVAPVASGIVRDVNPAISPDRRWVVFASTRGRTLDQTSLWLAPLGVEAEPVRLTDGAWIDSHPAWTPDGRAIVFASTRDGGDFDLWRLPLAAGRPGGPPEPLTAAPSHEVTPAVAADGAIVYAAVTPKGGRQVESRLEERTPDGAIRALTEGPADASPAISPDGAAIAFARPAVHDGVPHSELWRVPRRGGPPILLVELPLTDESGPVWSPDGRFVFATSVLRGAGGRPLFSSVIHVDLQEVPAKARILRDRAGAIARFTPAVAAARLDAPALRGDPEYLPELARIMAEAVASAQAKEAAREAAPPKGRTEEVADPPEGRADP
jgi:Tol biopolymer transport system component